MDTKGHSNVRAEQTVHHETVDNLAMIPIEGGTSAGSVRPLPPLALRKQEWEAIGRKMGWLK